MAGVMTAEGNMEAWRITRNLLLSCLLILLIFNACVHSDGKKCTILAVYPRKLKQHRSVGTHDITQGHVCLRPIVRVPGLKCQGVHVLCVHVQPDVVLSEHDMCVGHA